jgi:hypothetical protein
LNSFKSPMSVCFFVLNNWFSVLQRYKFIVYQIKDVQDRPIIRIIRDKDGRKLQEERIVDLVKVLNVYIEKGLE